MSEAPAELWLRKQRDGRYHETHYDDEPEVVRYVRADLYEALQARLAVVRSGAMRPAWSR